MFSGNQLQRSETNYLDLHILPAEQENAWQQAQCHSNPISRYNAYLNRLCVGTFLKWMEEWLAEEKSIATPSLWPNEESLPAIWEVVTGTAIQFGQTKLVLIPSDSADTKELCVPQEWVDNPQWAADYYLAVPINLDEDEDEFSLQVCGFTTHRKLKNDGKYHHKERTYSLPIEALTENLSVMQITFGLSVREEVAELPILSEAEVTKLLQVLGDSSLYSPRLQIDVPFEKWAALLGNDQWRQQLYNRRMGDFVEAPSTQSTNNLSQWFRNIFNAGWQEMEEVLDILGTHPANLAYRNAGVRKPASSQQEAISTLIELLQNSRDQGTQLKIVDLLGHIAPNNEDAIQALTNLLNNTQNERTRREASLSLRKITRSHSQAGIRRAKIIDLGMQLNEHQVVLVVTLMPEAQEKTNIHLRVYPVAQQTYLPPNLHLIVVDESGETVLSVQSRNSDNAIQLEFKGDPGDFFSVKLALEDANVTENFVI